MSYVFCYGSLKKGFRNHHVIGSSTYMGTTITDELYDMYSLGTFPAVSYSQAHHHIQGEIYKVDKDTLNDLDELEGNGFFYERKLIKVVGYDFPVWMYFLCDESFISDNLDNISIRHGIMNWMNSEGV